MTAIKDGSEKEPVSIAIDSLPDLFSFSQHFNYLTQSLKDSHNKESLARMVYLHLKKHIYQVDLYDGINDQEKFCRRLDRFFNILENNPYLNSFQKIEHLKNSLLPNPNWYSEDAIFSKLYPFRQMKQELKECIRFYAKEMEKRGSL